MVEINEGILFARWDVKSVSLETGCLGENMQDVAA